LSVLKAQRDRKGLKAQRDRKGLKARRGRRVSRARPELMGEASLTSPMTAIRMSSCLR